jgi:hypothetical protein
VVSLQLGDTTESSMVVSTLVNFTNPTQYSATVPFIDLLILYNNTAVAHITTHNLSVVPGNNSYVPFDFFWCPSTSSGIDGVEAGRALFSSYISGQCPAWTKARWWNMLTHMFRLQYNSCHQDPSKHNSISPASGRSIIITRHHRPSPTNVHSGLTSQRRREQHATLHPRRNGIIHFP